MPRNKTLLKGRGGTGKKIVIRPYQKPPTLPPNYYETTVKDLLQVTLSVLDQKRSSSSSFGSSVADGAGDDAPIAENSTNNAPSASASPSTKLSLQNAYTAVVNLVSHQYGPRLYQDLRMSMHEACERVLPDTVASRAFMESSSKGSNNNEALHLIPALYQSYMEYLLCVKHVFLPLDRTHVWQADTQQVLPIRGSSASTAATGNQNGSNASATAAASGSSSTSTSFSPHAQQSLWQVGLSVWADRLTKLGIDKVLYQSWLQSLLNEWNPGKSSFSTSSSSGGGGAVEMNSHHNLQAVWYMWQDLGWLSVLPLQNDLEEYWEKESQSWEAEVPYRPVAFLSFCYHKHQFIHQWPWLPSTWLMGIVEQYLLQPHLLQIPVTDNEEDIIMAQTSVSTKKKLPPPGLLLQAVNFDPLLEDVMFGTGSSLAVAAADTTNESEVRQSSIAQLWMLAGRLPQGQPVVAQAIAQFARTQGLLRVRGGTVASTKTSAEKKKDGGPSSNHVGAVGDLLQLQDALVNLIRALPHGGDLINLKTVWEEVVNQDTRPSVAESLAKFLDQILRNNKKMDQYQQESKNWLSKIISGVFVPLQAKDIFEAFYKRDLAKRLLWNRVVSMDVEKQVCSLLKAECGAAYTSKMEGMFQDVDWSRETMMVYKQASASHVLASSSNVEMEVQVLTTGYWPVYPEYPNLQLPESLRVQQEHFTNHYKTKYQGRRMTWQYALGHCIVKATGFARQYELIVGLCQAVVLRKFETGMEWKIPDLMQATGLEDREEMERILQSLSVGKDGTRILRKLDHDADPSKKKKPRMNVDDKDTFVINENFSSNSRRIRIPNFMVKESKEEREKTVEAVSRDRLYLIDAVLVRIMKARKTIAHQALIPQVLEQVKVPAQPSDVKKRIESLIEREYMERDPKDRNRYNYLA